MSVTRYWTSIGHGEQVARASQRKVCQTLMNGMHSPGEQEGYDCVQSRRILGPSHGDGCEG